MVYVNGEPRAGDPYGYGFLHLPVRLEAGENVFLFQHGRGALRAELVEPAADVFIQEADLTAPDFLAGRDETLPLGAVVVNATSEPVTAAPWTSTGDEGEHARIEGAETTVPAMSVRKVVFPVHYDGRAGESLKVTLGLGEHAGARREVDLAIKAPGQMYKRTFLSRIDGSCQYYAVQPRIPGATASSAREAVSGAGADRSTASAAREAVAPGATGENRPALVLSLHGASVEATNQAAAYAPKTWADIVCPTNRRPFGFDWEDWGRIDAMEVLDDAMRHLGSDPTRVYLTGHSMGGHGAWAIGTLYPDRFAAIAPSAGWLSFATYGGAGHPQLFEHTRGVAGIFARAARASDTSLRLSNLKGKGIYILHGDADDNVPVREAREMAERLSELGMCTARRARPRRPPGPAPRRGTTPRASITAGTGRSRSWRTRRSTRGRALTTASSFTAMPTRTRTGRRCLATRPLSCAAGAGRLARSSRMTARIAGSSSAIRARGARRRWSASSAGRGWWE
jgi:poly(3-hydroxybutyrate) depolymerase